MIICIFDLKDYENILIMITKTTIWHINLIKFIQ